MAKENMCFKQASSRLMVAGLTLQSVLDLEAPGFGFNLISPFISLPENPRLLSLGMNGTRNAASGAGEVEANPA